VVKKINKKMLEDLKIGDEFEIKINNEWLYGQLINKMGDDVYHLQLFGRLLQGRAIQLPNCLWSAGKIFSNHKYAQKYTNLTWKCEIDFKELFEL
jgi:hypothetical protein